MRTEHVIGNCVHYQPLSSHVVVTVNEGILPSASCQEHMHNDDNENSTSTLADESAATIMESEVQIKNIQKVVSPSRLPYRPDIDGLRTIAVVAVVFFHAYRHVFPGGFIGVDIFFVISGYLITGIIFKQHHLQKFKYSEFYSRRIRRIFPSLLLVMISTLVMGCLWLRVINLEAMVSSLVAGTIFGANIQIMTLKGGYFDPDVDTNPLLHLWSLGVEEQFYIIWPFLAGIIIRSERRAGLMMLFLFIGLSFGLNIGLISVDQKFSFYFPLSRFWQMAVGSVLAYVSSQSFPQSPECSQSVVMKYCEMIVSSVGLCLIVLGFIFVNEDSVFPGWWSLLPTVGAAFLIYAGPETPFNKYVLGSRFFVFIGKVSYPLYLWHWPLLVYANELYPNGNHRPVWAEPWAMAIFALLLSIITYYLVENRVRHNKSKLVVPALSGLMVLLIIMGGIILSHAAYFSVQEPYIQQLDQPTVLPDNDIRNTTELEPLNSSRGPPVQTATLEQVRAAVGEWKYPPKMFVSIPRSSPYSSDFGGFIFNPGQNGTIVVLGDSHANMVSHRFVKLFEDSKINNSSFPTIVYKTRDGTPPLPCHSGFASNIALIKKSPPKALLVVTDWPQHIHPGGLASNQSHSETLRCCRAGYADSCSYQSNEDADEIIRQFSITIKELVSMNIKVFVANMNPQGNAFRPRSMYDASGLIQSNLKPMKLSWYRQRHASLIQKVETAIIDANATIIDFAVNMCWKDICEVLDPYGNPIMKDADHFRPFYARNYVDVVDKVIHAAE
ncbi:acyltransferase family-domain-containing protein [Paraphysoderma sedebokerense]|nr:acyltransferase family-domain-containing protein [Paraphysoderma sedebokerense]